MSSFSESRESEDRLAAMKTSSFDMVLLVFQLLFLNLNTNLKKINDFEPYFYQRINAFVLSVHNLLSAIV